MKDEMTASPASEAESQGPSRRQFLRGLGAGFAGLTIAQIAAACGSSSNTNKPATNTNTTSSGNTASSAHASPPSGSAATSAAASPGASNFQVPQIGSGSHTLKLLLWSHFVPAFDKYFDKWATDWGSQNNVKVVVDHFPTNGGAKLAASEIAAKGGHDMMQFQFPGEIFLYSKNLIDVTDLSNYFASKYGGWIPLAQAAQIDGKWRGIPEYYIPYPGLYRKDLYDQEGLQPSDKWSDLLAVGQKLKPKGHQVGVAISQTGDSNGSMFAILWSYGASTVQKDGKTIAINSAETKAAIEYVQQLYKEAMLPEVLSWDDASNNQLLDSGVASWIHNPISALRSASPDLQQKIYVTTTPAGPKDRLHKANANTWGIWEWSKEQDVAKKFLVDYYAQWLEAFKASTGYDMPLLQSFAKKPMPILGEDPKLQVLQDIGQTARPTGYPGPITAAAQQVEDTYVITSMFAKAVTGASPEQAIAQAEQQLKTIYAKFPTS